MATFQSVVIYSALAILVIVLVSFYISINYSKAEFPPVTADCPDYWKSEFRKNGESTCVNTKNLGKANCEKTMNFNEDIYKGSNGVCNKMKWANACNITWDGITNNDNECS